MTSVLAAAGGGAPVGQLAAVAVFTSTLTVLTLALIFAHRAGGAQRLGRVAGGFERVLGVPGWAALPGAAGIGFALLTLAGSSWDIGLHIDVGRDEGPLGTTAHYPLLVGLFGMFLMGLLAIGLAPKDPRRASVVAYRIPGFGPAPAAGVLQVIGSSFGMLAFPLDDLWHRIFGQDVTLWGPTHLMIIAGTLTGGVGAVLLLAEGARAVGRDPFGGKASFQRPLALVLSSVFLYLWASAVHEFNWGVPQFRQIWHPLLLTFGGAQTLVMARLLAGKGGALGAVLVYLPASLVVALFIKVVGVSPPAVPLFVAAAVIVELVGLNKRLVADPLRFGAVAGLLVGTVGFAAEYGWSQIAVPLPWGPALLPEAIPTAIVAGLAGGLLSALAAQALTGSLAPGRKPLAIALASAAAVLALCVNAAIDSTPKGVTATTTLTNERTAVPDGGHDAVRVADLSVRLNKPGVGKDANWVYALGWQGGGRYLDRLERQADGTFRSTKPVPISGKWKAFLRIHKGRDILASPIRMGADPAIGFAGFPAQKQGTRPMVFDQDLMQVERKKDAPMALWTPATLLVLSLVLAMLTFMAVVFVRLGRMVRRPPSEAAIPGLIDRLDRVLTRA